MFVVHETDRVSGGTNSMCVSQLTDRGGVCRGLPPGPQGRAELGRTRDGSLDTALTLPLLLAMRGFGAMGPMLRGVWACGERCKKGNVQMFALVPVGSSYNPSTCRNLAPPIRKTHRCHHPLYL